MDDAGIFKVVVLGDPEVGKSAFIKRFVTGTFDKEYVKRSGVNFSTKTVILSDGKEIRVHFWDILGTSRVIDQAAIYFRNTHGAIIMYSANEQNGKAHVAEWKQMLDENVTLDGEPFKPPVVLVANKLDLVCQKSDEFDREELYATTEQLGFLAGYPCSVTANWNINPIITTLINKMVEMSRSRPNVNLEDEVILFEDHSDLPAKEGCVAQ